MHDEVLKGAVPGVADVILAQLREGVQQVLLLPVRPAGGEHLQAHACQQGNHKSLQWKPANYGALLACRPLYKKLYRHLQRQPPFQSGKSDTSCVRRSTFPKNWQASHLYK